MKEERRRWRFLGRVQGVGFRAFCVDEARSRGARGWVRNEPDGSVSVEAEAAPRVLDALFLRLKRGPTFARVDEAQESTTTLRGMADELFAVRD